MKPISYRVPYRMPLWARALGFAIDQVQCPTARLRASFLFLLAVTALLSGCVTHYPHSVVPSAPVPDNSSPPTYPVFTSGYYGEVKLSDGRTWCSVSPGWHAAHPSVPARRYDDDRGNKLWAVLPADFNKWYASTL